MVGAVQPRVADLQAGKVHPAVNRPLALQGEARHDVDAPRPGHRVAPVCGHVVLVQLMRMQRVLTDSAYARLPKRPTLPCGPFLHKRWMQWSTTSTPPVRQLPFIAFAACASPHARLHTLCCLASPPIHAQDASFLSHTLYLPRVLLPHSRPAHGRCGSERVQQRHPVHHRHTV